MKSYTKEEVKQLCTETLTSIKSRYASHDSKYFIDQLLERME